MKNKKVYIVLTQTYTNVARIIKRITHDKYSHVSITFDPSCTIMYSFGRKYDIFPFIGIFKKEDINKGLFTKNKDSLMAIYELKVNQTQYKNIDKKIREIELDNKGYNIIGLILASIKIKLNRKKYYCSEFVYEVLSSKNVNVLDKDKILFRPEEIVEGKNFNKIYEGKIIDYIKNQRIITL